MIGIARFRDFADMHMAVNPQRFWIELGLMAGIGLALAAMGPFGTFEKGGLMSLGYWMSVTVCWFLLSSLARKVLARWRPRLAPFPALGLRVSLATPPMMLFVTFANQAIGFDWQPTPEELAQLFWQVLLLGGGISYLTDTVLDGLSQRGAVPEALQTPTAIPTSDGGLLEKLPPSVRGPILCLEMEDHYVRIHTARGSGLVLMRMTDAVAQVGTADGLRVHRSWWVAADAVRQVSRRGRTVQLDLGNGLSVPVSQPHLKAVTDRFGPPLAAG